MPICSHPPISVVRSWSSRSRRSPAWSCLGSGGREREGHACIFHSIGKARPDRPTAALKTPHCLSPFPALSGPRMGSARRRPRPHPPIPVFPRSLLPSRIESFLLAVPGEISCHFDLAVSKPLRQRHGEELVETSALATCKWWHL